MILEIDNLSKRYKNKKFGLKDFCLTIENGILGLLGPNGAGKSTLLKMLATVSKPTGGSITLNGHDIVTSPDHMRGQLGFLPQDFGVYPNLNAHEFLRYMSAMKGIGGPNLENRISMLLEGLNLTENAKRPIGTYSGGMKQRIGIAQALLNSPKVVLFDEPTVGLDPKERVRFRNLISELAYDSIVILSSHIVSDIDTIADSVAIMKDGNLLSIDEPKNIVDKIQHKVHTQNLALESLEAFKQQYIVIDVMRKQSQVSVRYIDESKLSTEIATLEDAYLYLIETH